MAIVGKKTTAKKKTDSPAPAKSLGLIAEKNLLYPLVTEKTSNLESQTQYVFLVPQNSNKTEIKKAIKEMYGYTPIRINIMITQGKHKRFGARSGKRSDYKKAIITMKKSEKLNIHAGL